MFQLEEKEVGDLAPSLTSFRLECDALERSERFELQSDLPLGPDISANVCLVETRQPCRPAWSPYGFSRTGREVTSMLDHQFMWQSLSLT